MVVVETSTDWLILNKPSGLSVFPRHHDPESDCVLKRLLAELPTQAQPFPKGFEGGLAHRLDIPTSGMLIVARSNAALAHIRSRFTHKEWSKEYLFISTHRAGWEHQRCSLALAHHPKSRKKMVAQRYPRTRHRGKWYPAETRFRYLGALEVGHLYSATMRSGVMHQIRVHAAEAGIPLLGDLRYGGDPKPDLFEADFALHHLGLSCSDIKPALIPPPEWWPKSDTAH